jgi:hypothetical protein
MPQKSEQEKYYANQNKQQEARQQQAREQNARIERNAESSAKAREDGERETQRAFDRSVYTEYGNGN